LLYPLGCPPKKLPIQENVSVSLSMTISSSSFNNNASPIQRLQECLCPRGTYGALRKRFRRPEICRALPFCFISSSLIFPPPYQDSERVLCKICDEWLAINSNDHVQAIQKWLQHRSACQKFSAGLPPPGPEQEIPKHSWRYVHIILTVCLADIKHVGSVLPTCLLRRPTNWPSSLLPPPS
jgi:hypothetical protein